MQPLAILVWIIIGGIAGWLAGIAMKSGGGALTDIVVGVLGALIGGLLFSVVELVAGTTGFNIWSIFAAVIGAVILLFTIRLLNIRRRWHTFN